MDLQESENSIPNSVTRPLFLATIALFLALCGLGIWAGVAPLATTIRASGTIASSAPSYEVQHPFGGHITRVNVKSQSAVAAGQIMFELDTTVQVKNLTRTIKALQEVDIWCYAADTSGKTSLTDLEFAERAAWVIGSEHEGVSRLVLESCDEVISIPMPGPIESFNVATSDALGMYEYRRRWGK